MRPIRMCTRCTERAVWEDDLCAICLGIFKPVEPKEDRQRDPVTCTVERCDEDIKVKSRGLCSRHYQQARKNNWQVPA